MSPVSSFSNGKFWGRTIPIVYSNRDNGFHVNFLRRGHVILLSYNQDLIPRKQLCGMKKVRRVKTILLVQTRTLGSVQSIFIPWHCVNMNLMRFPVVDRSSFKIEVLISPLGTPIEVWIPRIDDSIEIEQNEASIKDLRSKALMEND